MKVSPTTALIVAGALTAFQPARVWAQHHGGDVPKRPDTPRDTPRPLSPPEELPARTIEIRVTEKGFEPARLVLNKGEHIRLVVTRLTDDTCVKTLVIDELLVWNTLPLRKPFVVIFTAGRVGEYSITCPTRAIRATIIVEGEPAQKSGP